MRRRYTKKEVKSQKGNRWKEEKETEMQNREIAGKKEKERCKKEIERCRK